MTYPICLYGNPVLKIKAGKVKKDEVDVIKLSHDMFETMYSADGIGLAAPQIGISLRIFVIDGASLDEKDLEDFKRVFINPQIITVTGNFWEFKEGCLSIPNINEFVSRREEITISYYDENWKFHTDRFDGMKARIIQHEYDHIEGKLFTDYLSPLKRKLIKGKLTSISKGICDVPYKIKASK
jgi:peptide deformylase